MLPGGVSVLHWLPRRTEAVKYDGDGQIHASSSPVGPSRSRLVTAGVVGGDDDRGQRMPRLGRRSGVRSGSRMVGGKQISL